MRLCKLIFTIISSLPCLHTFWNANPTSFYIFNVFLSLVYICLKAILYCLGMYPEIPGEMQIIKSSCRVFLNAVISFTYTYSLACLSVATSLWVMAQILVKVERGWSQDGHLYPIQFLQLCSTFSPEQQPTDSLQPFCF